MINNSVYDSHGNVAGFRCHRCGKVYQSMWGEICNKCRNEEEHHQELIGEIRRLRKQLADSK